MATRNTKKYPQGTVQLNVRIPVDVDTKLRELALAGNRTLIGELLGRLRLSFKDHPKL